MSEFFHLLILAVIFIWITIMMSQVVWENIFSLRDSIKYARYSFRVSFKHERNVLIQSLAILIVVLYFACLFLYLGFQSIVDLVNF